MLKEINIKTGEMLVEKSGVGIRTGSIGSCVVIAIYEKALSIGGLAHAMLPSRRDVSEVISPNLADFGPGNVSAKYADEAVDNLVYALKKMGGKIENMEAKLVGGASMFKKLSGDKNGIGFQNLESVRFKLRLLGIQINSEDTGGSSGKSVIFDLQTGLVEIITTL